MPNILMEINDVEDFIYRTVQTEETVYDEDGEKMLIKAWRTRNSNGYSAIGIQFGKDRIEFKVEHDYEQHARKLAELLLAVCDDPCTLPVVAR